MVTRTANKKNLSVRTKILVALGISMLVLCVALLAASFFVIESGFTNIEQEAMQKDLSRLTDQLQNAVHQELVSLNDWSTWDESYRFALHPTKEFTDTNLMDTGLANLDIELVAYFDTNGKVIFAKEIDHATGNEVPDDATLAVLTNDPLIATRSSEEDILGGFVKVPNGILQFGSRPLLQSTGKGPTSGSLIFARYLDDARVKAVSDILHLSIDSFPYTATNLPEDVAAARAHLDAGALTYVVPISEGFIVGYTALKDVHGVPISLLRITEPRPVHAQGNVSIFTFYAVGGAALILFGLIILLLIDRFVIARFVKLTGDVEKINEDKNIAVKLDGGEMDEIGRLAEKINQLLAWLLEAREGEAASRREIVNLLDDLKKEKDQAEEMARILASKDRSNPNTPS